MIQPLTIASDRPVLIAGPTASGKSALALALADQAPSVIINADAFQIYDNWRVLTARPSAQDEAAHPHALYGHVAGDAAYSAGHWLRDLAPLLAGDRRAIVVGGTGLYFAALTQGLAEIPPTPPAIRQEADDLLLSGGISALLPDLDAATLAKIDQQNPMRVQRAWEVQRTTGRGLADWHTNTPPPLLPLAECTPILVNADTDWLNTRIAKRFDQMLDQGALDEARANLPNWTPADPSSRAIGAGELISHLKGDLTLAEARSSATIATRQYAKRQRTWFRARMQNWHTLDAESISPADFA